MLTVVQIRALKPAGRSYKVADVDGLYLLVQPSGALLWRFRYKGCGIERKAEGWRTAARNRRRYWRREPLHALRAAPHVVLHLDELRQAKWSEITSRVLRSACHPYGHETRNYAAAVR